MNVLITGGTGFIGKFLIPELKKDHKITIFGRSKPQGDAPFTGGDLRDYESVKNAAKNIDAIVHLGAVTAGKDPLLTIDVNVRGTQNILEAMVSRGIKKIVFASSIAVLGCLSERFNPHYLPVNELHPCEPEDIYGLSKLLCEEMLKTYSRRHKISACIFRICPVMDIGRNYGSSLLAPKKLPVLWSMIDVRDVVHAITLGLGNDIEGASILNIGMDDIRAEETNIKLIKGYYPDAEIDEKYFKGSPRAAFFDIKKSKEVLGFKPRYKFRDYLKREGEKENERD